MSPDINSLPPPRSSSLSSSPRSTVRNPAEQATGNLTSPRSGLAGSPQVGRSSPHVRTQPYLERRRSSIRNESPTTTTNVDHNLSLPQHHRRAPSLGELHQELESEQELQVNRLLAQIRLEQQTIAERERGHSVGGATSSTHPAAPPSTSSGAVTAMADPSAPVFPRSRTPSFASSSRPQSIASSLAFMPSVQHPTAPRGTARSTSASLSRQSSMRSDRSTSRSRSRQFIGSPAWTTEPESWTSLGLRDELSFLQTETANITRENQLLKNKIRELERTLGSRNINGQSASDGSSAVDTSG